MEGYSDDRVGGVRSPTLLFAVCSLAAMFACCIYGAGADIVLSMYYIASVLVMMEFMPAYLNVGGFLYFMNVPICIGFAMLRMHGAEIFAEIFAILTLAGAVGWIARDVHD